MRRGKIPVAMQKADEFCALHCGKNRIRAGAYPITENTSAGHAVFIRRSVP
jgi:hypothetical protein